MGEHDAIAPWGAFPVRLLQDARVTPFGFRLWCYLYKNYYCQKAPIAVGLRVLADAFDVSRTTVAKALKNLADNDWVSSSPRARSKTTIELLHAGKPLRRGAKTGPECTPELAQNVRQRSKPSGHRSGPECTPELAQNVRQSLKEDERREREEEAVSLSHKGRENGNGNEPTSPPAISRDEFRAKMASLSLGRGDLTLDEAKIVKSMLGQFAVKGHLTAPQSDWLKNNCPDIEDLPPVPRWELAREHAKGNPAAERWLEMRARFSLGAEHWPTTEEVAEVESPEIPWVVREVLPIPGVCLGESKPWRAR